MLLCQFISPMPLLRILLMLSRVTGELKLTVISRAVAKTSSVYIPAIFVLNKIDAISIEELDLLYKVNL